MKKILLVLGAVIPLSAFADTANIIVYNRTDLPMNVQNPQFPPLNDTIQLDSSPIPPHTKKIIGSFELLDHSITPLVVVTGDKKASKLNACMVSFIYNSRTWHYTYSENCLHTTGFEPEVLVSAKDFGGDLFIDQSYYDYKYQ